MEVEKMDIVKDEGGQGAAEYILLFGGVIVIAIVALIIYYTYFTGQDYSSQEDIATVRSTVGSHE
ncbi:MAG: class III signal peptide-containing protein [Methanobacteriaceae archaeon]|nr:class III signal peptide-containing protein [Methanobacteriaceae archaeon]